MSRNSAALEKSASEIPLLPLLTPSSLLQPESLSGDYEQLRPLFTAPSAVAIVGQSSNNVCESLAKVLASSGKRVIVVPVERLLRINPKEVPDETAFVAGNVPNVWHWPSPLDRQLELFKPRLRAGSGHWLDSLRRNFDAVLLHCECIEATPSAAEITAMADAAVLVVDGFRTAKQQVQREQHALQLTGAKLVGCILIQPRQLS
jgi:hypothetical protein